MIPNSSLLENEVSFDKIFCDVSVDSGFFIYYNSYFSEDPIFNHASFSSSVLSSKNYISEKTEKLLDKIARKTSELRIPASLYVERFWRNSRTLQKDAIDFGFVVIEQMHILKKKIEATVAEETPGISVSETKDIGLWNRAFAKSFTIPDPWIPELVSRLKAVVENDSHTLLLAASEDGVSEASGCLLLRLHPPECMGVYCVGTIPERRNHGVARVMMAAAEKEASERGCEVMVLQTLESDRVAPMYFSLGYETAFERDVLQLR